MFDYMGIVRMEISGERKSEGRQFGKRKGLAENAQSCEVGDSFEHKEDISNRRRLVNLVRGSHGFLVGSKFYPVICWVAPLEYVTEQDAPGWSGAWRCL